MIIAIAIDGSQIQVGCSQTGEYIQHSTCFTTPISQRIVVTKCIDAIVDLIGRSEVESIAVVCSGTINNQKGTIVDPREMDWRNLRISKPLQERFDCQIILEQNTLAAGLAEARLGVATSHRLVCYMQISARLTTALLLDKLPLPNQVLSDGGAQIIQAGSNESTFDQLSSTQAIKKAYGDNLGILDNHAWQLIAKDLSLGIHNIAAIVQPDCFVIGGELALYYKQCIKPLRKELQIQDSKSFVPIIVRAQFIDLSPLVGAMLIATGALE